MAAADEAREDACREYQSSLEDLTFNSKPHINMLTILAEENLQFAKDIVTLIEAQIAKAPSTEKLPVMYLMDSIVKNVGRDYLAAFAKNIVSTFVIVFEKVDENTRKSLYKLRSTWDDIFTSKKLYALDVRVNQVDPAWPIKPLPPNVNTASIHVNPKFLNKPEESTTPAIPAPKPVPSRTNPDLPKPPIKQEQIIRQQLLMKQKQLLELQQKKLELELEQTKAQLANSVSSVPAKPNVSEIPHVPVKAVQPTSTTHSEKNKAPVSAQSDKTPVSTRDPRLNRGNQHSSHTKDQAHKKEMKTNLPIPLESKPLKPVPSDKTSSSSKQEKNKPGEKLQPKKELVPLDIKCKAKSPSPLIPKLSHTKDSKPPVADGTRDSDANRRDPRLRKHVREKSVDKPEEIKEKRKSTEKKEDHKSSEHRLSGTRNKIVNGVVQKNDSNANDSDKLSQKLGRSSNRKRSRSRSPKSRRDRRSPLKRRQRSQSPIPPRSRSPIPSVPKNSKLRQPGSKPPHTGDFPASARDERSKRIPKLDPRDSRRQKRPSEERQKRPSEERQKRPSEERQQELITPVFSKSGSEPKENVENWQGSKMGKRWRPGWEEGKSTQNEDHHQGNKTSYPRHRDSWSSNSSKGIVSPRTPKQQPWLSVDANLKIPKELTNASKAELLQKANDRLASGEITQDDFLMVAHQIRQIFQYQEEKNRCLYSSPTEEEITSGGRKKPLLSNAELTYYQHKAKLKRTQLQQNFMEQDFMDESMDEMAAGGREGEHMDRIDRIGEHMDRIDRIGEQIDRISNSLSERNEPFPERMSRHSPMPGSLLLEEDLSHEGHRIADDPRELPRGLRDESRTYSERYPHKRTRYDDKEQVPFVDSTDPVSKDSSKHVGLLEERRPLLDIPTLLPSRVDDGSQSFEDLGTMDIREDSPVKRFDGPLGNQAGGQLFENVKVQPMDFDPLVGKLVDSPRFDNISGQPSNLQSQTLQRFEGVQNRMVITPPTASQRMEASPGPPLVTRFDGPQGPQLGSQMFDGIPGQPIGPPRFDGVQQVGQQRFDAGLGPGPQRFDGPQRYDGGPVPQTFDGSQRFEGVQRFEGPQRFDGVGPQRFEGAQRFDGNAGPQMCDGPQRFEGPLRPQLLQQRFEGSQVPSMRFEQAMQQPVMFGGTGQQMGNVRFDGPHGPRFDVPPGPRFDGPTGPRFDGPRFDGLPSTRFEGPPQGPRFDANKGPRFDHGPGPQGLMRFDGPMGQVGPRFDNLSVNRFENHPALLPRYEGVPGQPCTRFDGPPAQQTPPRFDGPVHMQPRFDAPMSQRFDGPNQQPRFDMPIGPQGQRFENLNPPIGQNTAPFVQNAPFVEPQNVFHGQSQGMQFPRPEQRYDMPQGQGFTGPPAPGMQLFPNQVPRPAAPYFDDKNPQGPPFGNFNLPVANIQPNPPFPSMGAMTQPAPYNPEPMIGSVQAPTTGTYIPNQAAASFSNPENHLGQLDVNELFSKLLSTGIIKGSRSEPSSSQTETPSQTATAAEEEEEEEEEEEQAEEHEIPDLTSFVLEEMKPRFECVITRLYTGIQCYSCGMRFTKSQTDVYADHLDWHYRQNRTEKDVSRKITHRRWYYSLTDWIEFEEIADLEERAKSQFFEKVHEEVILKTQEAAKEKEFQSVPAGPAGADEICEICQEQFEQYWDEEEEEWHLKNAMRVNDKIYHPSCYEDYKNTSSFLDSTPSPSKVLLENPLSAMLSLVKEEATDTTHNAVAVKEEATDDRPCSRGEGIPLLTEVKSEPTDPE